MALQTYSKILGINDCKITSLTTDNATTLTYAGTSTECPGITSLKISPKFVEKTLTGDEATLDQYTKLESIEWSIENALVSLDALAILLGGTVTASGTTPNQKQTYTLLNSDLPKFFKLEGQSVYSDMGDVHVLLYKCKCNKIDYEVKGGEYASISASGIALGTIKDKKVFDFVFNETAAVIS